MEYPLTILVTVTTPMTKQAVVTIIDFLPEDDRYEPMDSEVIVPASSTQVFPVFGTRDISIIERVSFHH